MTDARSPLGLNLDRRTFVQGAAAVAASGAIGSTSMAARRRERREPIRVGLIGCGGRGTGAAFQAMTADAGATLWAMGDVFPERIESAHQNLRNAMQSEADARIQVPEDRRFVGFDAYQQVIDSGVDLVILTTPPGFRPAHLEAAVAAGKHVFTEKPMAVDAPGVRRCLAACESAEKQGLSVVAGFCWRYGDAERAIFDEINRGALGSVLSVHTTYHTGTLRQNPRQDHWSDMEWQLRNWWHFCWLSGDHIAEQACHSIDRLAWATGDRTPVRCTALGGSAARRGAESGDVYDHFTVIYEYADGTRAFHTCRQIDRTPSDNSDYIYGTDAWAEVNGWKPIHDIRGHDGSLKWSYDGPRRDMYQNEHDVLFKSIRDGAGHNDGEWMMRSTMMSIMGRMAAYTGQVLTWEQALASEEVLSPETLAWGPLPVRPRPVPGSTPFA